MLILFNYKISFHDPHKYSTIRFPQSKSSFSIYPAAAYPVPNFVSLNVLNQLYQATPFLLSFLELPKQQIQLRNTTVDNLTFVMLSSKIAPKQANNMTRVQFLYLLYQKKNPPLNQSNGQAYEGYMIAKSDSISKATYLTSFEGAWHFGSIFMVRIIKGVESSDFSKQSQRTSNRRGLSDPNYTLILLAPSNNNIHFTYILILFLNKSSTGITLLFRMNSVEKYSQPLVSFNDLPTPEEKRSCTDIFCLVVGLIYSLIIIAIAAILFSKSTFMSVNFPTDSEGQLCGYDLPQYQYVYFSAAPSIAGRVCVSKCPTKGDLSLSCKPNSVITSCNFSPVNKYIDSVAQQTRYGFFCWPVEKALTTKLKEAAHILVRSDFFQSLDAVKITLVAALGFSVALLISAQYFTTCLNYAIVLISAIALVFAVVLVFAFETDESGMRTAIGLTLVTILIILAVSVYKNSISIKVHAVFLNYASKIISGRLGLLVYIVIYFVSLILLMVLVILEFVGFWSAGRKIFLPAEYIYYKLEGLSASSLVAVILAVQLIWGTAFLKQSFNFCLSGNAISWYFQSEKESKGLFEPLWLQLKYHCGSVIACSFMTSFFSLFDFLFDIVKPVQQSGLYAQCFATFCSCLVCLWDLVRSDSMTMVALTGNPFCNSARYCEYLCNKTPLTEYSQSVNRIYSLASHFFIVGMAIIFSIVFTNNKSIFALLLIVVGTLTIATFFISLHADIAESIQIIYLMEQEFSNREKGQEKHRIQGLGMTKYHSDLGQHIKAVFTQKKHPNPARE